MTRRQRLEAVINGNITPELIEDCKVELAKLDLRSADAMEKAKDTAHYNENREFEERICRVLSEAEGPVQVDELAELIDCTFARQRLTAICTNLVRSGRIRSCDVKVKGKGKRKAYYVE